MILALISNAQTPFPPAQTAHRRIAGSSNSSNSSTTIPPPYPAPHQNFGNSSRIISAVGISPIASNFVAPTVNALSPMYTGNSGGGGTSAASPGVVSGVCASLPPAIPARLHETIDSGPPPLPPPSIDLSAESSSVTVLSSAASGECFSNCGCPFFPPHEIVWQNS